VLVSTEDVSTMVIGSVALLVLFAGELVVGLVVILTTVVDSDRKIVVSNIEISADYE